MTVATRDSQEFLNAFASEDQAAHSLPAAVAFSAPTDRVFGAQQVAVRRDEARVLQKLRTLAAAAGENWYYRFPVKRKDGGKDWIEGPSIKLANDLARCYGNCDVDVRVFDLGDSYLFYARFLDLETGYSLTRPFQQRKAQKTVKTDDDRARDIVFQIGASKAIRNVVVNALQTFADFAFDEAKAGLVTKVGKQLDFYRHKVIARIGEMKIDLKRVETASGRASADWLAPDVARIISELQAIQDGMASIDDTYPQSVDPLVAPTKEDGHVNARLAEFAATPHPAAIPPAAAAAGQPAPSAPSAPTEEDGAGASAPNDEADPVAAAFRAGRDACEAGVPYEAIPDNIKRYTRLKKAWQEGYAQRGREMEGEMNP